MTIVIQEKKDGDLRTPISKSEKSEDSFYKQTFSNRNIKYIKEHLLTCKYSQACPVSYTYN